MTSAHRVVAGKRGQPHHSRLCRPLRLVLCVFLAGLNLTLLVLLKALPADDPRAATAATAASSALNRRGDVIVVTSRALTKPAPPPRAAVNMAAVRDAVQARRDSDQFMPDKQISDGGSERKFHIIKEVLYKPEFNKSNMDVQVNGPNVSSMVQSRSIKAKQSNVETKHNGSHNQRHGRDVASSTERRDFVAEVERQHADLQIDQTAFGRSYTPSRHRTDTYDFRYILPGEGVCRGAAPYLVILVLSVHTHIDTRDTIRRTWGRAAVPGVWPRLGQLADRVRLVFLLGRGDKEIKNKIVEDESATYGDIVQADFRDSYFNLTRKVVTGLRWVAEFCPGARYILKADEDVFVHVPNLISLLKRQNVTALGAVYGHLNQRSAVLRDGKWAVSNATYPLPTYPPYVSGNTYVISGHIASRMFYIAGHLPYMNIEDVFVCGIVRTLIGAAVYNDVGFTHWFEKKPRACEFKNNIRISSTKTDDSLKMYIWEEQKTKLADCYHVVRRNSTAPVKRPENHVQNRPSFRHSIRDEHIFFNKSSGQYYVV